MKLLIILGLSLLTTSCIGVRFGNTCSQFGLETESVTVLDMDTTNADDQFTQTEFKCVKKEKKPYTKKEAI